MENKKIALVTGASRGIGKAIAEKLAQQNYFVIGTATSASSAEQISIYLGGNGKGMVLNVADPSSIESLAEQVENVDILVNNAGITRDGLLMRMKDEDWLELLQTNLTGTYRMSKTFLRGMTKKRFGRIINIGSVVGSMGNAGQTNYCSAKAGVIGFSKALAKEVANRGVTVNVVAPGFIATDMTEVLTPEQKQRILDQIPAGRLGSVEDVANAVAFLASEEASYITGTTMHINGGLYLA